MAIPSVDVDVCTGCGVCVDECPNNALELVEDKASLLRPGKCDGCGSCSEVCPVEAITMIED